MLPVDHQEPGDVADAIQGGRYDQPAESESVAHDQQH